MPKFSVRRMKPLLSDLARLRLFILMGGVLIALFMIGDLALLPAELEQSYLANRLFAQLPIVFALLAFSFHPLFLRFKQPAVLVATVALTYANYFLIFRCWQLAGFSFPYEGTLLYAFFGFFVLGMNFGYALALMLLSSLGFLALMLVHPVYGDRTMINAGFVLASLFVGVIGRHRLDHFLGQLQDANRKLVRLSTTDALTGLSNRRALMAESEKLFSLLQRSGQTVAVFMLDLDFFKQFNDHYGHQEGDKAIRTQADIMREVFRRQTDVLGRYGGEEFLVVAPGLSAAECQVKAREVLQAWQQRAVPNAGSPNHRMLSCSIGVCHGSAVSLSSLHEAIQLADEALYQAKNNGRATYAVAASRVSAAAAPIGNLEQRS